MNTLGLDSTITRIMEDDVRDGVYTLQTEPNGSSYYAELIHYNKKKV